MTEQARQSLTPPNCSLSIEKWRRNFYFHPMNDSAELKMEVKRMLVENLMLKIGAEEIGDGQLLFGPNSLGLDSVDALQLVVALDKNYGLKIADPAKARKVLESVNEIAAAIRKNQN